MRTNLYRGATSTETRVPRSETQWVRKGTFHRKQTWNIKRVGRKTTILKLPSLRRKVKHDRNRESQIQPSQRRL